MLTETEGNTNIILVNVDSLYDQDSVQNILESSQQNPDKIIKGKNFTLVKPKFFNNKIRDFKGTCDECIQKCCSNEQIKI